MKDAQRHSSAHDNSEHSGYGVDRSVDYAVCDSFSMSDVLYSIQPGSHEQHSRFYSLLYLS